MPFITLRLTPGTTDAQKAQVIKEFTETLERVMDKRPEWTNIVIEEVPTENWGHGGITLKQQFAQESK
ncbi:tautomerase family protein [Pseudomonas sp. TTU2014-080ASC]|uniref:tautomerase family protein n=1 Tax=Pseudomonas sp. TTU2014-080ASC TaxID=1729724 RepID=UPI000718955D|nr:4-oxalocrotonate tautomerase family protein [Pseudomonas sp. TTU2014-080ASC]KRW59299.1 4-oxalocrotonate tautomerase [Pseudomonas sp. TTU2014-080ASC]